MKPCTLSVTALTTYRRATGSTKSSGGRTLGGGGGGGGAGSMWRFYTGDDSPGIKMYVAIIMCESFVSCILSLGIYHSVKGGVSMETL